MRKLSIAIMVLLLFVAACEPVTVVVTATSLPPSATVPPTADEPTPTAEFFCTPVSTDHRCFLDKPINPNAYFDDPPLTLSPNQTRYTITHPNGTTETVDHRVQYPAPDFYYAWHFDLLGNYQGLSISGWIPDVYYRYNAGLFAVNITSVQGEVLLELHGMELQAGQSYLLKLVYALEVFSRSGKPYEEARHDFNGRCRLQPDNGSPPRNFPLQGLNPARTSWTQTDIEEEVVIAFTAGRDMTVIVACGVKLNWPAWEGEVLFKSLELVPVDWTDLPVIR